MNLKLLFWLLICAVISLGFNVGVLLTLTNWRPFDAPPAPPSNITLSAVPSVPAGQLPQPDMAIAQGDASEP